MTRHRNSICTFCDEGLKFLNRKRLDDIPDIKLFPIFGKYFSSISLQKRLHIFSSLCENCKGSVTELCYFHDKIEKIVNNLNSLLSLKSKVQDNSVCRTRIKTDSNKPKAQTKIKSGSKSRPTRGDKDQQSSSDEVSPSQTTVRVIKIPTETKVFSIPVESEYKIVAFFRNDVAQKKNIITNHRVLTQEDLAYNDNYEKHVDSDLSIASTELGPMQRRKLVLQTKNIVKKLESTVNEDPPGFYTYRDEWTFESISGTKEFKCGHCCKTKPTWKKILLHIKNHYATNIKRKALDPPRLPPFVVQTAERKYLYCKQWAFEQLENGLFKCSQSHQVRHNRLYKTMKEIFPHLQYHAMRARKKMKEMKELPKGPESDEKVRRLSLDNNEDENVLAKFIYDEKWHFNQVQDGWKCNECGWFKLTWREMIFHIHRFHVLDVWTKRRLAGKRPPRVHLGGGKFLYDFTWPYEEIQIDGKTKYKCSTCDAIELHVRYMSDHILGAHAEKGRFNCSICSKQFVKRESLFNHQYTHGEAKFLCTICGKRFKHPNSLAQHQKFHQRNEEAKTRIKRVKSAIKSSTSKRDRQQQQRMSRKQVLTAAFTNEAPFKCSVCQRGFYHFESMRKHQRSHKKGSDRPCPKCPASFLSSPQLLAHLKHVHPVQEPTFRPARQCRPKRSKNVGSPSKQSHKVLTRADSLAVSHTTDAPFKCPVCLRGFQYLDSMRCHRSRHKEHTDRQCPNCPLNFLSDKQLSTHLDLVHPIEFVPVSVPETFQENPDATQSDMPESLDSVPREDAQANKFPLDVAAFEIVI